MVPLVGRSRPTIIRAIVVLPEPDSPTMASDRPGGRSKETSSTATNSPNSLRSPVACSTGALSVSATGGTPQLAAQLTCPGAARHPAVQSGKRRHLGTADVRGVRAAGREGTLLRRCLERGQRAAGDGA